MNINMEIPGLKDVIIEKIEELNDKIAIHVKLPLGTHTCPNCGRPTKKVHDYRVQKVNHLKWFERLTVLFYKLRRYVCSCGKRFSEPSPFVCRSLSTFFKRVESGSAYPFSKSCLWL